MIPRSMRTGGMDLPGVESRDVPLIGYRPLASDDVRLSSQSGQVTESTGLDSSEGETSPMKTTWYCPLDLSTVLEEKEDGVIYNVVVKQQRSAPTSATSSSRSQCVKAGTEEKLVQHLLHSFAMGDSSFITIFLATYRSFTSTKRVLDILMDRLQHPPGESTKSQIRQPFNRAVCMVFSMWLSEYPEDFRILGEPGLLLHLAPLLPSDPSGTEIRGRLLRLAEELSEQALLPDSSSGHYTLWDYDSHGTANLRLYEDVVGGITIDIYGQNSPPNCFQEFSSVFYSHCLLSTIQIWWNLLL